MIPVDKFIIQNGKRYYITKIDFEDLGELRNTEIKEERVIENEEE